MSEGRSGQTTRNIMGGSWLGAFSSLFCVMLEKS